MDIGLREWLMIIGVIVIIAILIDWWRRVHGSRTTKLRIDKNFDDTFADMDLDAPPPEIIKVTRNINKKETSNPKKEESTLTAIHDTDPYKNKKIKEQQITLNLEDEKRVSKKTKEQPTDKKTKKVTSTNDTTTPIRELIVINVVANQIEGFKGPALLQNILESGLRFGDMDIFHRHESMTGNGERYFSMANGVKPGTFDLDDIDHFSTRAVCFFLNLPGPKHPKRAFDIMLAAARKLSSELDGELRDDQHSIMTAQTIEHYRQRIVDFERRTLMQKRS